MKILHVIPTVAPIRGGPSQVVLNLTKNLRECGVDAEIATTNDNGAELLDVPLNQRVEYYGVPVWFFPQFSHRGKFDVSVGADRAFMFSLDLTRWLWQHIRDYDLINTHYLFSYAPTCAGAIARWQKVPYIVRPLGMLAPWALAQSQLKKSMYTYLIERQNLNRAAAIHCTSAGEVEDVRNFGIETPTITLPLGVEQPFDIPQAKQKLRHSYGISSQTPIVLFFSRLHPKKRPDLLLHALAQVAAQNHDFHLILAGAGKPDYITYITNLSSDLNLANRISIPGLVTGEDKNLLLQGSDIFVLPSFAENFGVAVAEAMAAGLPAIVTSDVQISPEIAAASAGLVVKGEVEPLASAIAQLLEYPQYRSELGENGRCLTKRCYSWTAIAPQLADTYSTIIQTKPLVTY